MDEDREEAGSRLPLAWGKMPVLFFSVYRMSIRFIFYSVALVVFALTNTITLVQADATANKSGAIKRIQSFDESHKLVAEYFQTPDGKSTGIAYSWYSSGDLKGIIPYDNGRVTGTMLLFYKGRVIKSECRKDDILDGPDITYYMSGFIKTKQMFLNGKPQGSVLHYDEKGNLSEK